MGLEVIERIDAERAALQEAIADAEARINEWTATPSSDAVLDFYVGLRDLVQGRVAKAAGAAELHATLTQVLAGAWLGLEGTELRAEFQLCEQLGGDVLLSTLPGDPGQRIYLPGIPASSPTCR